MPACRDAPGICPRAIQAALSAAVDSTMPRRMACRECPAPESGTQRAALAAR